MFRNELLLLSPLAIVFILSRQRTGRLVNLFFRVPKSRLLGGLRVMLLWLLLLSCNLMNRGGCLLSVSSFTTNFGTAFPNRSCNQEEGYRFCFYSLFTSPSSQGAKLGSRSINLCINIMHISHHLRFSPYIHSNLMKFRPDSLLQSIQFQNNIQVECVSPDLSSMITYSNYINVGDSNVSSLPCKCYFCTAEESQPNQCKECKRTVCFNCSRLCLKCNIVYCRAEVKYNYELEGEICSNCEAWG